MKVEIIKSERCEGCGKYRPFQSGLCWQCKDAVAKYEAEYLRMAIDELLSGLAVDYSDEVAK